MEKDTESLLLASTKSTQKSLEAIRIGKAGLDKHRKKILERVPDVGDWAKFNRDSLELKDLAYLTAITGDEFALLRGKREDILFHGDYRCCRFNEILFDMLKNGKLELIGHSHPGEDNPEPSTDDREVLKEIKQKHSQIISGRTGRISDFDPNQFDDL